MKNGLLCLLIISLFSFAKCNKDKDAKGLPAATQEGKNTLGFLANGQIWIPKGVTGMVPNLGINVDLGYNNGVFSLTANQIQANNQKDYFGIGMRDSLNILSAPFSINLSNNSLYRAYYSSSNCTFYSTDSDTNVSGTLTVAKLDKANRIIAGTFNATLSKSGCSTIQITEGRFDMKY